MTTTHAPPKSLTEAMRQAFEQLAEQNLNDPQLDGHMMLVLTERRADLSPWARWALWLDVRDAYLTWSNAENGEVNWDEVEAGYRDPELYALKMRAELDEQLDTLMDGCVVRVVNAR
jgi:hypothetical protein